MREINQALSSARKGWKESGALLSHIDAPEMALSAYMYERVCVWV